MKLKKQYQDETPSLNPQVLFVVVAHTANLQCKPLSGSDWYCQQAMRAVNQAIGRVIRHRTDFGAIILCDERFANGAIKNYLSAYLNSCYLYLLRRWLRPCLQTFKSFGEATLSLARFFKYHNTLYLAALETKLIQVYLPMYISYY